MTVDTYNGWANRETWALQLWLSNDQGIDAMTRERVAEAVAEHEADTYFPVAGTEEERNRYRANIAGETVKSLVDELFDPSEELLSPETVITMLSDIGSLYRVDWDEIGAAWLPEEGDA